MAKQSGLGDNLYVDGYDISGDIGSLSKISGSVSLKAVTGIDKSAFERLGTLRDGSLEFMSFFDKAAGAEFQTLKTLPGTDRIVSYWRGTVLGSQVANIVSKQISYDGDRKDDGLFTHKTEAQANGYGLEWGVGATAGKRSDTTATNGSSIDLGVGTTNFGLQAYLQVFSFTGTSVTVKLQASSDNGAGDAFADVTGGAFAAATGVGAQRIETGRTAAVERYLRVVTTGTFTQATFAVAVVRNDTAVQF